MNRFSKLKQFSVVIFAISVFSAGNLQAVDLEGVDRLFSSGKYVEALKGYEELLPGLKGDQAAQVLSNMGYCYYRMHKNELAIEPFERALKVEGIEGDTKASVLLRMGTCLRLTQRSEEAIAALDKAAEMEGASSSTAAQALLGSAWERQHVGREEEALEQFRKVSKVPDVHNVYIASALTSIGKSLQNSGKYQEAIEEYKKVAPLNGVAQTKQARARVYKMECEALLAGDMAFHIKPYVSKVSGDSANVYWVTQGEISPGRVELTIGKDNKQFPASTSELKETICHLNKAEITGLQPGTVYEYTAYSGDEKVSGSFKTSPGKGEPINFCVIGDTQSYHMGLQHLLDAMGEEQADFILHVGDITDRGNMWGEWKASFFDPGRPYLKHSALWPAYGNHDGGPYFPALFDLGSDWWYSFDYGDAHFIALDSYGGGSGGSGRARQLEWLKKDLAANKQKWTIAYLHVPMVATRRGLDWFGADDFLPVLEEHEVDIIFSGHHPHYRRYYPIGKPGKKPILHITTGGGGGPVGGYMPSPVLALGIDVNHYTKVQIDGDRLLLTAHAISGAVIDRFELIKDDPSGQEEVLKPKVATSQAKEIIAIYQELLADRTLDLHLWVESDDPQGGEEMTLVLDLEKLPRGKLQLDKIPEDATLTISSTAKSPWKIEKQTVKMHDGILKVEAEAPEKIEVSEAGVNPTAEVTLQLTTNGRSFEPVTATARLRR